MAKKEQPGYNPVATALLEPFDESEIKQRDGAGGKTFSYVPPERYRYRLLKVFDEGFDFGFTEVVEGKAGVRALAHFKGTVSANGVAYNITGIPVYEEWTIGRDFLWNNDTKKYDKPNPKAGQILDRDNTYASLVSAGLKAVSREMGLGLHLYDKAPDNNKSGSSTKSNGNSGGAQSGASSSGGKGGGASASGNYDPEWDGSEEITFGQKWKGHSWYEVDDGYLAYLTKDADPEKHNKKALKEIARRQHEAGAEGASQAKKAMDAKAAEEDDDDIPF